MNDPIDQFKQAIKAAGLTPPELIINDGAIHRFSTNGKPTDDSGWYVLHSDGLAAGSFGDWRTGMNSTWCSESVTAMSEAERQANRERIQAMQLQREADLMIRQTQAAADATKCLKAATPCADHAYLTRKGIKPPQGVKVEAEGFLIVPMRDTDGNLWNVERINPADGSDKKGLYGGRRTGLYFSMGKPAGSVTVCEGLATGASIHEATGGAVAVAFNVGNVEAVATALRTKFEALKIIIASDDDHLTPGNPGLKKARAAALAVGGYLAVPDWFPHHRGDKDTDFNDLHQLAGLDAVKACIDRAELVTSQAGAAQDMGGGDAWPDPTPLPDALPPADSFDADLLPVALRPWVMDIAHRMQCPADFPAVAALVALSSLIGARAVIQPKARDDWQVVPNLWGAVIGRPGVKKSPALSEALRPLHRLEAKEFELSQAAHESWELDRKVTAMQDEANEKKAKRLATNDPAAARQLLAPLDTMAEPTARRFVVNDATVEKLGELMQHNEWGILSYRDELYGLLTSLDKQGQEGARTFYLQSYDGNQGYTFDRIGRGTVHIPRVCLAMIGGIQPGRIQEYVRGAVAGGSADDGLLQRFGLTVWPDVTGEFVHVDQWPDTPAKQTAWAVFDRLAKLQPASDTDPVIWRFGPEAQALFVEWLVPFEIELRGNDLHPAMVSHLAKYRKLIPALALVFALIDTPDSGGVVHEDELLRALAWGDFLRSHANRLYAAAVVPETSAAAGLLAKIKSGKLVDPDGVLPTSFTPRQVAMKHWAGLATAGDVRKAADLLVEYDYLRRDVVLSNDTLGRGRPSERYLIHPVLLIGGAK